jgi:hypothetical protein
MGTGASFEREKSNIELDLRKRVDFLETIIFECLSDASSNYYLVFDNLDSHFPDKNFRDFYKHLLNSLFNAVIEIRKKFKNITGKVRPVVLLRDDIYSILEDPNKNKWNDLTVHLLWDQNEILNMLLFRISKSYESEKISVKPDELVGVLFDLCTMKYRNTTTFSTFFRYITDRTLHKPRDYIAFIREGAYWAEKLKKTTIDKQAISYAEQKYSKYMFGELQDELLGFIDNANQVIKSFGILGKNEFSYEELEILFENCPIYESNKKLNFNEYTELFYDHSIIGYKGHNGKFCFAHEEGIRLFEKNNDLMLFPGLWSVLNIPPYKHNPKTNSDKLDELKEKMKSNYCLAI